MNIYKADGCGCLEVECEIGMFFVILHMEPDGKGEAFIDCGEWEDEIQFDAVNLLQLYRKAESYILAIPVNNY